MAAASDLLGDGSKRQVSGSVTGALIGYIRVVLGDAGVRDLMSLSGEQRGVSTLTDPTQWSSYEATLRLFEAAAAVSGDETVALAIGAHLLNQHAGTEVAALLRSLGSTEELLRNIATTASKYSTVTTMHPLELRDGEAVVAAVTSSAVTKHRHFCLYTAGVLSQTSVLFGHDPAVVVEDECQARGDDRCLYRVRWRAERGNDPHRRIANLETQLSGLAGRFEALQATATAFTTATTVAEMLEVVTRHAGVAVRAPQYLLAVHLPAEQSRRLHHEGFSSAAEAEKVADDILTGAASDRATRLVAEVRSSRSKYGVLAAIQPEGLPFFPQERQLLEAYAAHAASALEVASALEEARRQNETARALLSFGRSLAEVGTVDLIVERLMSTLPSVVDCHSGAVLLWDPEDKLLRIQATFGMPDESDPSFVGRELKLDDTPAIKVLIELREPLVAEPSTEDPFLRAILHAAGMRSAALVPILGRDVVIGAIAVGRRDEDFRPVSDDIERLSGIADLAATAFANARFIEAVQIEALHDPLTGLANARHLARIGDEALLARAGGCEVALLFLDLDDFKPVNDELGHDAGDEVLRMCASRLKAAVRDGDTVARLGGDEFVVLMPIAGQQDADATSVRLHHLMEAPFVVDGRELTLSASIGVALSSPRDEFATLLKRADEAMYTAKPRGTSDALRSPSPGRRPASLRESAATEPAAAPTTLRQCSLADSQR